MARSGMGRMMSCRWSRTERNGSVSKDLVLQVTGDILWQVGRSNDPDGPRKIRGIIHLLPRSLP